MENNVKYRRELWKLIEGIPGDLAEVGVAEGRFSLEMLQWPGERKLYLVDRWDCCALQKGDASNPKSWHQANLEGVKQRTKPFAHRVRLMRGASIQMAQLVPDGSLALVYVDADHSLEGVMADGRAWWSKLVKGGVMAFHDYLNPNYGVKHGVELLFQASVLCPRETHCLPEDKIEDAGVWVRK